jgi:hypothetical protein
MHSPRSVGPFPRLSTSPSHTTQVAQRGSGRQATVVAADISQNSGAARSRWRETTPFRPPVRLLSCGVGLESRAADKHYCLTMLHRGLATSGPAEAHA